MIIEDGGVLSRSETVPNFGMMSFPVAGQYKTFRILYVPDPSRELEEHPYGDLGWMSRKITWDQYEEVKHLHNACFIEEEQPEDVREDEIMVEIMEWVSKLK